MGFKETAAAFLTLHSPVAPSRWRAYARGLMSAPGWMPSMMQGSSG